MIPAIRQAPRSRCPRRIPAFALAPTLALGLLVSPVPATPATAATAAPVNCVQLWTDDNDESSVAVPYSCHGVLDSSGKAYESMRGALTPTVEVFRSSGGSNVKVGSFTGTFELSGSGLRYQKSGSTNIYSYAGDELTLTLRYKVTRARSPSGYYRLSVQPVVGYKVHQAPDVPLRLSSSCLPSTAATDDYETASCDSTYTLTVPDAPYTSHWFTINPRVSIHLVPESELSTVPRAKSWMPFFSSMVDPKPSSPSITTKMTGGGHAIAGAVRTGGFKFDPGIKPNNPLGVPNAAASASISPAHAENTFSATSDSKSLRWSFTPRRAGTYVVTGRVTGGHDNPGGLTTSASIVVNPGDLTQVVLDPSGPYSKGTPASVSGLDQYGNQVFAVSAAGATLKSSDQTDTVSGTLAVFGDRPGTRTLTATWGGKSVSTRADVLGVPVVPGPLDVSGIAQKAVSGEVQPQAWPLPVSYACIQDIGLSPVAWTGNKFSFAALTPGVFTATCQGTNAAGTGPEFQIRFTATVSDPGEDTGNAAVTTVVHANLAGQDATVTTSGPASGAIQVGDRLTNDIQAPAGWAWHYQWYRTVKTVKNKKAATAWKAIRRATGSYYKPTVADAGKKIRARITFTQGPTQVVVWTKARSVAKVGATVKLTGVWKNGKPAVKVKITAKKGLKNPTGTIAVRVNGTRTVVKLRSTHKGVVTVPLRKVTLGTATRIKASYSGPAATAKRVATATVTFTGR